MLKLVVLSAILAVAAARPSLIESHPVVYTAAAPAAAVAVHEPVLTKVGSVVKSIPTAVSHQSQSIVHSSAHVVQDIVAPAVKTSVVATPTAVLKAVAPAALTVHSAPVHHIAAAPLLHHTPVARYSAPLTQLHVASPLTYTATGLW